jgi:LPS export ABC transporter protein LptC
MRRIALSIALALVVLSGVAWWFRQPGTPWQAALTSAILLQEQGVRMERFSLRDTERHQTRWEILADVAQVDPQVNTTTLEGVHLTLFSAKHGTVQVTASRGFIQNQSKNMQVCGDVRLVRGEEFSLVTECLQWFAAEQALVADTPVTVEMGNLHVEGRGFRGWIADERFEVHEQVLARWSEP